jgi:hypothetical protein
MAFFYEIRSIENTALKRDGGIASPDEAKMAAREDAKKMCPGFRALRANGDPARSTAIPR